MTRSNMVVGCWRRSKQWRLQSWTGIESISMVWFDQQHRCQSEAVSLRHPQFLFSFATLHQKHCQTDGALLLHVRLTLRQHLLDLPRSSSSCSLSLPHPGLMTSTYTSILHSFGCLECPVFLIRARYRAISTSGWIPMKHQQQINFFTQTSNGIYICRTLYLPCILLPFFDDRRAWQSNTIPVHITIQTFTWYHQQLTIHQNTIFGNEGISL